MANREKIIKMRIFFITHSISNVQNTTQFQRAKCISENYDTYFFTVKGISEKISNHAKVVLHCPGYKIMLHKIIFPFWILIKAIKFRKASCKNIAYTTYDPLSSLSGFLLKFFGFKWFADIWDDPGLSAESARYSYGKKTIKYLYHYLIYIISKFVLKYADMVILALVPEILSGYKIKPDKIVNITNGVNINLVKSHKNLDLDHQYFNIFYVGHVNKIRGLKIILEAARLLKAKLSNFRFVLIGRSKESDYNWLMKKIFEEEAQDYIKYFGEISHERLLDKLNDADICLFPFPKTRSLDCIYPIKVFEYMAMGKTVIASRLKGVSSIINNWENGILIEPENPQELSDTILSLYQNPKKRKEIEHEAIKTSELYDWQNINKEVIKALR